MGEELLGIIPKKEELTALERFKVEKEIFEKYGEKGVVVYMLSDGKKSAEEIRAIMKVEDKEFIEMVSFLETKKLLSLRTVYEIELEKKYKE